jgi:hypothetical protein
MLGVYPTAATAENWVHEAIVAKVRRALAALDQGNPAPPWVENLPAEIHSREALATRYAEFCVAAERLSPGQRAKVLSALEAQNNIPAVFDGVTPCPRLDTLPARARKSIKGLFAAAFEVLKSLKIRDRQFARIFASPNGKYCPFCGIEPFEAPGLAREDLDHYLPKQYYPLAGANLRNLAPMGGKCNSAYKLSQDVICDGAGQRRRCFDPYGNQSAQVSLIGSRPFEGNVVDLFPLPAWQIDLLGEPEAVATWDQVFHIRRRYEGKVNAHFRDWIEQFAVWCDREVGLIETRQQVIGAIDRYMLAVLQRDHGEASHLKRGTFEMLRQHCHEGDGSDRLVAWFSGLVRGQRQLREAAA